ncbi:hypothetical protein ACH5RR_009771 [Cinchona calisaya]|uniref:Uncharacterized protein n=1 Tax=Cinchona calisaya TaxID=153742 RepID=A0ABD3AGY6_9GENT
MGVQIIAEHMLSSCSPLNLELWILLVVVSGFVNYAATLLVHLCNLLNSIICFLVARDQCSRSSCEMLKVDEWPISAFISVDCRPTNPFQEAYNVETAHRI